MQRYRRLFSIRWENPFYPDMKSSDFTLTPSEECEMWLRNYRLFIKSDAYGLDVIMPVDEEGKNTLLPFNEDLVFSFWVWLRNPKMPLFTDFRKTYDEKKIVNPVLTNEEVEEMIDAKTLQKKLRLQVKELEMFHTDFFQVPEDLPTNTTDFPFILHYNPRPPIAELFISLPNGESRVEEIIEAWQAVQNPKGFQLASMGDGQDVIKASGYEPLARPMTVLIPPGDQEGGRITNHWNKRTLSINIQRATSASAQGLFQDAAREGANFQILTDDHTLEIYVVDQINVDGESIDVTWAIVVEAWHKWLKNRDKPSAQGFILEASGSGSSFIRDMNLGSLGEPITFSLGKDTLPELIWPEDSHNGLKINYDGSLPNSRVKFLRAEADEPISFLPKNDQDIFSIEGNSSLEFIHFNRPANVVRLHPHDQVGAAFRLIYPAKPALPWGAFGKVEIHVRQNFLQEFPEEEIENQFLIHFFSNSYHWSIFLLVEEEGTFEVEDLQQKIRFLKFDLQGKSRLEKHKFIGSMTADIQMKEQDLSILWDETWDMIEEEELKGSVPPNTRRFLFISKDEKIDNRQLSPADFCLVRHTTITEVNEPESTIRTVIIPQLPPPERLKRWLQVIDLRIPEITKKIKNTKLIENGHV